MAKPFDDLRKQMSPERREKNRGDAEKELAGIEDCVNPSKGFHDLSFNQLAERVHALACIMAVVDGPMPTREELDAGHDEAMAVAGKLFELSDGAEESAPKKQLARSRSYAAAVAGTLLGIAEGLKKIIPEKDPPELRLLWDVAHDLASEGQTFYPCSLCDHCVSNDEEAYFCLKHERGTDHDETCSDWKRKVEESARALTVSRELGAKEIKELYEAGPEGLEAAAIYERARAQIQTLEKQLNDARQTALMLATKVDRDQIPDAVHTKLDLWETEPIAELARMVDGPRQPEGLPDPKDCAPPWTAFYVDGYPEAIMPAGRPGDVAIVRGLPEELVQRIIQCANAGVLQDRLKPGEVEEAVANAQRLFDGSKRDEIIQDFLEKTAPKERECKVCGETYTGMRMICGKHECEMTLQLRAVQGRAMRPIDYCGDNAPRGAIFFNDYVKAPTPPPENPYEWECLGNGFKLSVEEDASLTRVAHVYPSGDPERPWMGEAHCGVWGIKRPTFRTKEEAKAWCEKKIESPREETPEETQ